MPVVFKVKSGTVPSSWHTESDKRILKVGRYSSVTIQDKVPSTGKKGQVIKGGDVPTMPTPIRAYERLSVFGLQSAPNTITGATKGDAPWHGIMRKRRS